MICLPGNTVALEKNKTSDFFTNDFALNNDGFASLEFVIKGSGVVCDFILQVSNSRTEEGFADVDETLFEDKTELTNSTFLDFETGAKWVRIRVFNVLGSIDEFKVSIGKKA